ncbi:copper binding periplasmic CusF family protein [Delftia acidovorans]|uniref:copper-binding protein n=1 Tax=Delftia acidovorans TaxID=80866 RepID=UPI0005044D5D|nr:copper-binding protein [Delftia acidovorans]KFJ09217.1 copper binding periplasmic CusF family protein [Delftia acidovorans]QQB52294.1 copper-binding protein [Delftia acidovorans]
MHNTALLVSRTSRTALAVRLALAAALIPAWVCAQATAHDHAAHSAQSTETAPAAASQDLSEGEVTRWDARTSKVTLRHGELKNLGMPPMTMVFQLRVAAPEPALKAGDKVRFRAEQDQGAFVVTQLEVLR